MTGGRLGEEKMLTVPELFIMTASQLKIKSIPIVYNYCFLLDQGKEYFGFRVLYMEHSDYYIFGFIRGKHVNIFIYLETDETH